MNLNLKRISRVTLILLLSVALLLSLWRLAGWAARFAGESLQMDLSAFYTAGEALVVIALPDGRGAHWMTPALADLIRDKYILGEGLLLLALLGYLTHALANTEKTNE